MRYIFMLFALAALATETGCSVGLAQDRRPRLNYSKAASADQLEEYDTESASKEKVERKRMIEALRTASAFAI